MNQPFMAIPAPQDLIKKTSKEESVLLSLRVKPSTKQFFENIAADTEKNLSVNTLINELLESYVNYYQNPRHAQPISAIMCRYLTSIANKVRHNDDESLIAHLFNHQHMDILADENPIGYMDAILYFDLLKSKSPDITCMSAVSYPSSTKNNQGEHIHLMEFGCINNIPEGKKAFYTPDNMDAKPGDDPYYDFRDIEVVPEYWPTVITMANAYLGKLLELKPSIQAISNTSFNRLLTSVINNAKNREDLAQMLVVAFTNFLKGTVDD